MTDVKLNKDGTPRKEREIVSLNLEGVKVVKAKRNEEPPVTARAGRGLSQEQITVRNMVSELSAGEWFKVPMEGEKEQRALISHLRNAVAATHEGMGVGIAQDEGNVWFRIQPKSNRGPKPKSE